MMTTLHVLSVLVPTLVAIYQADFRKFFYTIDISDEIMDEATVVRYF